MFFHYHLHILVQPGNIMHHPHCSYMYIESQFGDDFVILDF